MAAGISRGGSMAIARYHPDGMPDNSFEGDGKLEGTFNGNATGVAIQEDGRILITAEFSILLRTTILSLRVRTSMASSRS